jgi:uncharacterized membrane protein YcaP (DUF421 family)
MGIVATVAERLVTVGVPLSEKVLRTVAVYVVVLMLLRLFGKRTAAQMNSFDLVVLLLLSNVVQNAIIGPDNSLLGGLIGAATLVVANDVLVRVVRRSGRVDRAMEGVESPLVRDGAFVHDEMRRFGIRTSDLEVALRRQGAEHVSQVKSADLYPSGAVVVDLRPDARDASLGDVERLERKLDRLISVLDRPASPSP